MWTWTPFKTEKAMYKLILFDLDGTLIDTLEDLGEAVNHALSQSGYPLHSVAEYRSMVGHGVRNLVRQALPEAVRGDDALVDAALADFKAYYTGHIDVHTRPYPGMQELLKDLDAAGVKMAVASNKFQSGTEQLIREFFPEIPFVSILGNREGYPLKPDPEIVGEVLRAAGIGKEDAVLVGDSGTDMQTAKNGGIGAIAVGWGYRPMTAGGEHGFAASVSELRTLLFRRPVTVHSGRVYTPEVVSPETMHSLILAYGIIPFFENPIPGFSIEDHTAPDNWFHDDFLGPWDWKIECVQRGDIAYGKFLWGGKAAFATVEVYRELMNWRRSRLVPGEAERKVLSLMEEQGSVSMGDIRKLLGVKKSAADAVMTRLQYQARAVTGDIQRVYRGADLHYNGWQRSSFCSPEALFEDMDFPFPGFRPRSLESSMSPEESLSFVKEVVRKHAGDVSEKVLNKMLA